MGKKKIIKKSQKKFKNYNIFGLLGLYSVKNFRKIFYEKTYNSGILKIPKNSFSGLTCSPVEFSVNKSSFHHFALTINIFKIIR